MSEAVWITTTTTPDGKFDFFELQVMLQQESTLTLYELIAECEAMELLHTRCYWKLEEDPAYHKAYMRLFGRLPDIIRRELLCRRNPALRPLNAN